MRKALLSATAAAGLVALTAGAAYADQCPNGYVCASGVPVWGGSGPNCTWFMMPSDATHQFGVLYASQTELAGSGLLGALQSAAVDKYPVFVLAQADTQVTRCDNQTGKVLSIKGVSPVE